MLGKIGMKEPQFYNNIARLKMAYAVHVLKGSNNKSVLLVLESKVNGVRTRGQLRRTWIDIIPA